MNFTQVISTSIITKIRLDDLSIDVFYIGTFIGLIGGFIVSVIIIVYKCKKYYFKSQPPISIVL